MPPLVRRGGLEPPRPDLCRWTHQRRNPRVDGRLRPGYSSRLSQIRLVTTRLGMKTFSLRKEDVTHHWYVVDATGQPLGRLASRVAQVLRGKHKPTFTP